MKTIHPLKQSGSSLVVVLTILATLMVVVAVAAEYTSTVSRHVQRSNTEQNAVAVGDSCIEILFAHWRKICSANPTVAKATDQFDTEIPLPTYAQLNLPNVTNFVKRGAGDAPDDDYDGSYTISNYKVVAVGPEWQALGSTGAAPEPMIGQVVPGFTTAGPTTSLVYNYMAFADVTLPTLGVTGKRTIIARVSRVFQKQQISPWNFAIFYVDPLEIHPGPDFVVTGWVHTNSDLYTAHDTLTFADKVTFGEDWTIGYMPGDGEHFPPVASPHYPTDLPPARDQALQPFGLDANSLFNSTDTNNNNDSYRELIEPPSPSPDPLQLQRYWDQADVVIQVDSLNNVVIGKPKSDGTISVLPGPTPTARDNALFAMFSAAGTITPGTSTSNGIIQDNREGGQIRLVTLDLSLIQNHNSDLSGGLNPTFKANDVALANGASPYFNGIVYIYDKSATTHALNADGTVNQNPTSPVRAGVRLKKGSKIAASGLTVVSPNPVYIQGDYNTGRKYDGSVTPPSNNSTSDPLTPQVTGYNNPSSPTGTGVRAPCSVLGDAVTILSNSWVDSASGTKPAASNTTVNTAIISGIVPTNAYGGNNYSGGAENFPRFLEAWDGDKFTYYGSMVELFKSRQSIAIWQYDPVYGAPDRQWYFDMNFRTKPPPGSLMLYSYIKGKWSAL
jgi:hypothetical protein